jgi:glycosyltransferase involved in cell wall biosynthesis
MIDEPGTRLSVVVPCYNEAAIIEQNIERLYRDISSVERSFEIVLCDDGSTDSTAAILAEAERTYPAVRAIAYRPNRGAGYAFRQALEVATGTVVMHSDADLAMQPLDVYTACMPALDEYDVVVASRYSGTTADYPLRRRVPSLVNSVFYRLLLGLPLRDAMSGSFVFKRDILDSIPPLTRNGFELYLEFFLKATQAGYRLQELPVKFTHQTDSGEVSVLAHAPAQILNTLRIWREFRFKRKVD